MSEHNNCKGCPVYNGASDFQAKMLEGMSELRAKMNKLVGMDGNNGDFSRLAERVDAHEVYINQQKGASGLAHNLYGAGLVCLGWLINWLLRK